MNLSPSRNYILWFRSERFQQPVSHQAANFFSQHGHDKAVFCVTEGGGSSEVRNRSTPTAGSKREVFEHTISAEPRGRVVVSF